MNYTFNNRLIKKKKKFAFDKIEMYFNIIKMKAIKYIFQSCGEIYYAFQKQIGFFLVIFNFQTKS